MQRAFLPLLLLVILGLAVWRLWAMRPQPEADREAAATPTAAAAPVAEAPSGPPSGYRLAGLAVGDADSFAAIELPDGSSHLYRVDSDVPGLGRVVAITHAGAAIEGEHGTFTLQLKPAATATPDRRRINGESAGEPTTAPERLDGPGDTALEPGASAAPDPRAF